MHFELLTVFNNIITNNSFDDFHGLLKKKIEWLSKKVHMKITPRHIKGFPPVGASFRWVTVSGPSLIVTQFELSRTIHPFEFAS